jgi:tetratricopeptide (TPR) repeat protein
MGKHAEADKDRSQAMQIQPRDARSWNARGEARLRISPADPEGALEDFRQASLTSPSLRNSYENMAHVLSEYLNRQDEAIAALDDAIECDSKYAMAWSSRSVLHARKGNAEAAIADAEQALRLDRAAIVCYQAASAYALVRRNAKDELLALSLLKETARQNPPLAELMKNDKDLAKIEDQKTLKQIIAAAGHLK